MNASVEVNMFDGSKSRSRVARAGYNHIEVDGWVRKPLRLEARELEVLQPSSLTDFLVICTFDGRHPGPERLRGVPLRVLVEAAVPAFESRTDFKRVAIVAQSRDGYRALFSWHELFNTVVGDGVVVAWDSEDAPLPDPAGPFALASIYDRATGPRFVQRLARLELHKLW